MIDFDDWLIQRMKGSATEVADLLRLALSEADEDSCGLLVIAQAILTARGGLDDLDRFAVASTGVG